MSELKTDKLGEAWPVVDMRYTHESTQAISAEAIAKIPSIMTEFRCSVCEKVFGSLPALQNHYASEHPDTVVPELLSCISTESTVKCLWSLTGR